MINYSAGGGPFSQTFYDALVAARDAGVLYVASAGNSTEDTDVYPHYPSSYDLENVISVASTDSSDALSSFSNWGSVTVDLGAPGSYILSTVPPFVPLFREDFETASLGGIGDQFTLEGPANYWGTVVDQWGFLTARGDAEYSYPYRSDADGWIVSPPLDMSNVRGASLWFMLLVETEAYADVLAGELWSGGSWQRFFQAHGSSEPDTRWLVTTDLKPYRDPAMRLRFGWQTDADLNDFYGAEVDNIMIRGIGSDYTDEAAYGLKSGTSMAAPHVAGAAALLLADKPDMCLPELRNRLIWTGDPLVSLDGITVSGRRLNVYKALTAPSGLAVTAPNGREHWGFGATHEISWSQFGCEQPPPYVSIHLLKGGSIHSQLADNVPNTGTFLWSVPEDLPVASDYRIRIDDGIDADESDAEFAIRPPFVFVDDDAPGGGDGLGWQTAFGYLRDALYVAAAGDEIYVAGGTYRPDIDERGAIVPGDRTAAIRLISGVALRGGYAGLANPADPDVRDVELYETILSGDLAGNDTVVSDPVDLLDDPSRAENGYHVVSGCGVDATAVLDGFTIVGGYADGNTVAGQAYGGGLYNCPESRPTVTACTFRGNYASSRGGGMYSAEGSEPTVTACTFMENGAPNGGGIYTGDNASTVTNSVFSGNSGSYGGGMHAGGETIVDKCTFHDNSSNHGGGIYSVGNARVTGCTFSINSAHKGGAIYYHTGRSTVGHSAFAGNTAVYGGGIYGDDGSEPTVTDCTFSGNDAAAMGGGICNVVGSDLAITGCSFSGNATSGMGGGVYNDDHANLTAVNCIFWGDVPEALYAEPDSTVTVTYSDVQDEDPDDAFVFPGPGNHDDDPLFVRHPDDGGDGWGDDPNTPGIDEAANDDYGDLHLLSGSPCIDAGENASATEAVDLDGYPRRMDGDADGTATVDMGAFEYFPDCNENELPDVCDTSCSALGGACDVPGCGSSADCSGNGVPDECDIALGTSEDCNINAVPDECEPDCNNSGQPDDCDIVAGTSEDLDSNGTPDECECATTVEPIQAATGEAGYAKCRYISLVPGNAGEYTALRVTLLQLPAPFEADIGTTMWVGAPIREVSENGGVIDPAEAPSYDAFWSAELGDEGPYYREDWSSVSPLHVFGEALVPGAVYEVQAIHQTCDVVGEPNYSSPLVVVTSRWGDAVKDCTTSPCGPPDGSVGITTDVTALLDKFRNLSDAPIKSRCDIEPAVPDLLVNITDVTFCLNAFLGETYPPAGFPPRSDKPGGKQAIREPHSVR